MPFANFVLKVWIEIMFSTKISNDLDYTKFSVGWYNLLLSVLLTKIFLMEFSLQQFKLITLSTSSTCRALDQPSQLSLQGHLAENFENCFQIFQSLFDFFSVTALGSVQF